MMARMIYTLMTAMLLLTMAGCNEGGETVTSIQNRTTTLQTDNKSWTYINLKDGKVVGTSRLDDIAADEQWKARTDWDIAFYDDLIRTNSGTSGIGEGGIQQMDMPYELVEEAPLQGYLTDEKNIEIYK